MIRRLLTGSAGLKAAAVAMIAAGIADRWVAVILLAIVAAAMVVKVRRGMRDQYWEPPAEQYARHWEDMVWDNTRWSNGPETPEQGIERLAGPWKQ